MKLLSIIAALALFGCEYSEDDLVEGTTGFWECTSNAGRPTLSLDTKTLKIVRHNLTEATMTFTDIETGQVYTLHTVEDRDYHCKRKSSTTG